jgi:hypothetical protein
LIRRQRTKYRSILSILRPQNLADFLQLRLDIRFFSLLNNRIVLVRRNEVFGKKDADADFQSVKVAVGRKSAKDAVQIAV